MENVLITQVSEKESKTYFVFSIIYAVFIGLFSVCFSDNLGTFVAFYISVFIFVPILYLTIIYGLRKKANKCDLSKRGFVSNWLVIISSFIAIPSYIFACAANNLFSVLIFMAIPMIIGIGFMIAFIVLFIKDHIRNLKLLKSETIKLENDMSVEDLKNYIIDFVSVLFAILIGGFNFFTFYEVGKSHDLTFNMYGWTYIGQILGIIVYILLIIRVIKKIMNKDYSLSHLNSFTAIGSFATALFSFAIACILFSINAKSYELLSTVTTWIPMMVFKVTNLVLIVASSIYFAKYIHRHKCLKINK